MLNDRVESILSVAYRRMRFRTHKLFLYHIMCTLILTDGRDSCRRGIEVTFYVHIAHYIFSPPDKNRALFMSHAYHSVHNHPEVSMHAHLPLCETHAQTPPNSQYKLHMYLHQTERSASSTHFQLHPSLHTHTHTSSHISPLQNGPLFADRAHTADVSISPLFPCFPAHASE